MDISTDRSLDPEDNTQIVLVGMQKQYTTSLCYRHWSSRMFMYQIDKELEEYLSKNKSLPPHIHKTLQASHGSAVTADIICSEPVPKLCL